MNQRISDLRGLSRLDTGLRGLAKRREEKTRSASAAEAALAESEAGLTSKRDDINRLQREADALNLEVQSVEEQIAKLEAQRNAAKSNKEYQVFTREIDAAKGKVSGLEDEALGRLERIDELTEEEKRSRRSVEDAKAAVASTRTDLAETETSLSAEEADLKSRRGELTARIDPDDLGLYEGILQMRKDSATSAVENGTCCACARRLTPQTENLVTIGEEIVQCMSCSRILYIEDGGGGS